MCDIVLERDSTLIVRHLTGMLCGDVGRGKSNVVRCHTSEEPPPMFAPDSASLMLLLGTWAGPAATAAGRLRFWPAVGASALKP